MKINGENKIKFYGSDPGQRESMCTRFAKENQGNLIVS